MANWQGGLWLIEREVIPVLSASEIFFNIPVSKLTFLFADWNTVDSIATKFSG